jgi:hypothetical protein
MSSVQLRLILLVLSAIDYSNGDGCDDVRSLCPAVQQLHLKTRVQDLQQKSPSDQAAALPGLCSDMKTLTDCSSAVDQCPSMASFIKPRIDMAKEAVQPIVVPCANLNNSGNNGTSAATAQQTSSMGNSAIKPAAMDTTTNPSAVTGGATFSHAISYVLLFFIGIILITSV